MGQSNRSTLQKVEHVGACVRYSKVLDSRHRGSWVWRKRLCTKCKRVFETVESEVTHDEKWVAKVDKLQTEMTEIAERIIAVCAGRERNDSRRN